jgi:hypothetical protein
MKILRSIYIDIEQLEKLDNLSTETRGTKAQRYKGTKAQRDRGTEG